MRIDRVEVTNFRALRNSSLDFSPATALIGENNSGKSAFLKAIDLFFANAPKVTDKDFSDDNFDAPIDITVHFADLTPHDEVRFDKNRIDGRLVVTRRLIRGNPKESGNFFVSARVNKAFSECRAIEAKSKKTDAYKELQKQFPELPNVKKADDIDEQLENWESEHPEVLETDRVGSFRGFKEVAVTQLKERTEYIFVRAVQDANEEFQQSRTSPVKLLVDTIARQTIENNADFQDFMKMANEKIADFTNPAKVPVLAEISGELTKILAGYYRDSSISTTWKPIEQIQPAFPSSELEVKDNDFVTNIDGVGHGLQRAIILTILQYVAERRHKGDGGEKFKQAQSDIIIAIEEPEIYQHPVKQRLFANLLRRLTLSFNEETGIRVQTVFVTHSPLLVSLTECEGIRMVRCIKNDGKRNVYVNEISLDQCAKTCAELSDTKPEDAWTGAQFGTKLHTITSEVAEGFFGKCVVLVEGVGDKAVIEATYRMRGRDPHAEGIVIAEVGGKSNLDKPIVVFSKLQIPCFWIFDNDQSDKNKKAENSIKLNRILQRASGLAADKCVDWPNGVFSNFASWDGRVEDYIEGIVGEKFQKMTEEIAADFDIAPSSCVKFPASASAALTRCAKDGHKFPKLEEIVSAIDKLI